jgi:sugar/nucleoside kinase (ribokinase family)
VSARRRPVFDVLVIGELNVDLLLYGDVEPVFGQAEKLVDDAVMTVGSSSAIFAHQAARLDLRVAFCGKVGSDAFGAFMTDRLKRAGIDTSAVVVDPALKTGLTVHLVRGTDRAMLTNMGAIPELRPEEVDPALLKNARHVHLGSYFLQEGIQEGLAELFARARAQGTTTSLDPGWDPAEDWDAGLEEALRETDVFMPNEEELLAITREAAVERALETLVGVPTVVVKRGASGALSRSRKETARCVPPTVEIVDTTGAGDSFDAGFLFGMLRGYDLERALGLGCLCGALSVTGAGGVEAQPDLQLLTDFERKGEIT